MLIVVSIRINQTVFNLIIAFYFWEHPMMNFLANENKIKISSAYKLVVRLVRMTIISKTLTFLLPVKHNILEDLFYNPYLPINGKHTAYI